MTSERVEDYLKDAKYERRIVAFCDVLGWRSHIANAGSDLTKIGELRRQILRVGRIVGNPASKKSRELDLRFSSFSDNIVLSGSVNGLTLVSFRRLPRL